MRSRRTKEHLRDISKEENVTIDQTKEVVESFFRFTVEVMREGDRRTSRFSTVRLWKWGVFKVRKGRRKHFARLNEKNRND
jgi:hypothetical protein